MAQTPVSSNAASPTANHALPSRLSGATSLGTAMGALEINHAAPNSEYQTAAVSVISPGPSDSTVSALQDENAILRAEIERLRDADAAARSREAMLLDHLHGSNNLARRQSAEIDRLRLENSRLASHHLSAVKKVKEKEEQVAILNGSCETLQDQMFLWKEVAENLQTKVTELARVVTGKVEG